MHTQLGPYLIDEELAEGGMARVFRARLRGLGGFEKQLVIKQIKPELARDPRFVELFVREANILVSLSHPHIVQVYELGAVEGTYYLSMEYVEGATIAAMLADGPLSPALAAHVGAQVCEALDYAHDRFGILHRDITPRNIIVDQAGHARLLDFGIATTEREGAGELFGSPGYMSPEQARREPLSPASDLFSLGCVLYEALTGRPAFDKRVDATATATCDLSPLPETLGALIGDLLAKDPAARPSAKETSRALRGYLAQTRPEGALEEMQARARKAKSRKPAPNRGAETRPATPRPDNSVPTQSIATSPILTQMLRSAPGVPLPVEHTRRIRERSSEPNEPAPSAGGSARLTRRMLRSWPLLAILALGASLALAAQRAPRTKPGSEPAPSESRDSQGANARGEAAPPQPSGKAAWEQSAPSPHVQGRGEGPQRADGAPPQAAPHPAPEGPTPQAVLTTSQEASPQALATQEGASQGQDAHGAAADDTLQPSTRASDAAHARGAPQDEATPDPAARATLSINALPWGEVSIDGRAHGSTPLRGLKLKPGTHRLSVRCPPLDRTAELTVELAPKADARLVVDLQRAPVRTFLDGAKEVR